MQMKKIAFVALLAAIASPAFAADNCSATVEGNDQMQYNTKEITIPKSCCKFTIELKHVGKMPKAAMGHNLVIAATADAQGVIADGAAAGAASDYIKAGDARVVAHTKLIGGGESDKVVVDVSKLKAGTPYEFFCTFPGHFAMMKGDIKLN